MVDPFTAAAAISAVSSLGQGIMNRGTAKKQAKAYNDAINLMREQMAREYSGLYGANATADRMSTGDQYQDYLLQELARQVQEREIQAAALNASRQNMTDLEAQRQAMLQLMAQKQAANSQALANASTTARRTGTGNAGQLLWQANRSAAADRNTAYNQARTVGNNNLQRLAQGTNLNTGSVADMNRQQAQNLYQNANANYQAAANNLAGLMTQRNQAKANVPSWGGIIGSAAISGANTYGQGKMMDYGAKNGWFGG